MGVATVVPVPVGRNNISYVVIDTETDDALLIDALEPTPVLHEAECRGARVVAHLTTHNHWDHAGGNLLLASKLPHLEFWSSAYEDTPACTRELHDEEVVQFGSLKMTALQASSHTRGHLMYLFEQSGPSFLFTGDTVFGGGCGRFFEGSALDFQTVLRRFEKMSPCTLLYFGHEYTIKNLGFARVVEPHNKAIITRLEAAISTVSEGRLTVPTPLEVEYETNPFFRAKEPTVMTFARANTELGVIHNLREAKDIF